MSIADLARPEIVAMKPYSSARSEAAAQGILLNANESPWPLIDDPLARDGEVDPLNRYPEPQHTRLTEHLAALYGVPEDHALLTRGSDEGIDLITRVFCRAGRDAILDTPPGFGMYRIAAKIQGAAIIDVPRDPDSLALDTKGILSAVGGKSPPRVVFLTSPANPTGDLVQTAFVDKLLKASTGRCVVVIDEAYAEFAPGQGFVGHIRRHENLAVLRTLSKAFGSAGLRCGTVLAQPPFLGLLRRILPPYPLATPVLSLALRLFDKEVLDRQKAQLEKLLDNKRDLLNTLSGRPFVHRVWPGEANFVLIRVADAPALVNHCACSGITIRKFPRTPLLENCVRITVGSKTEIERLGEVLDAYETPQSDVAQTEVPEETRHG